MKDKKGKGVGLKVKTEPTELEPEEPETTKVESPSITMHTTVSKLRDTLKLLQPVVPKKTHLPVLTNVLLKDGKAIANNLEVTVVLDFPDAEGQVLIPHNSVQKMLNFVPGNNILTIKQKRKRLELSWDGGKSSFDVAEPEDYPSVPKVEEKITVTIEGDRLIPIMVSMVDYCSTDDTHPILSGLTGLNLSLGEFTEITGADGFRLAYKTLPISSPVEDKMTIPVKAVLVLGDLWNKLPPAMPLEKTLVRQVMVKRQLKLTHGDGRLRVDFGQVAMTIQLIEGEFPAYKKLIPKEPPITIRVFAADLRRAVQRIREIAKDDGGRVNLKWAEDSLTISARSADKGDTEATIKVQTDGGPGKTAVNVSYLLGYLKGKEGFVSIGITSTTAPVLLRHGTSPTVVIMPMLCAQ